MTGKGIIFSAPMVRALLAGTKTQTRRIFKPRGFEFSAHPVSGDRYDQSNRTGLIGSGPMDATALAPYFPYFPGDRIYVREAWSVRGVYTDVVEVGYRASENASHTEFVEQWPIAKAIPGKGPWPRWPKYGPSIHMPRWASRLTLTVTDVRVERLLAISPPDAVAESIDEAASTHFGDPIKAYAALWDHLHGAESGHGWADNPWVVAVSFTVAQRNIDQPERAA